MKYLRKNQRARIRFSSSIPAVCRTCIGGRMFMFSTRSSCRLNSSKGRAVIHRRIICIPCRTDRRVSSGILTGCSRNFLRIISISSSEWFRDSHLPVGFWIVRTILGPTHHLKWAELRPLQAALKEDTWSTIYTNRKEPIWLWCINNPKSFTETLYHLRANSPTVSLT